MNNWYELANTANIDSPALLLYPSRVRQNIRTILEIAGDADRLIPHVKTHKMRELVEMQIAAGISKFKCATLAEAGMLGQAGAKWVLIAHQLVEGKLRSFAGLLEAYPFTRFHILLDNVENAELMQAFFSAIGKKGNVFLDLNNGMNRSGHLMDEQLWKFYSALLNTPHLEVKGLHLYDGHIRDKDFLVRKEKIDQAYAPIEAFLSRIEAAGLPKPMIIAGGTPAFTVHAQRPDVYLSPGTCLLWDWGYGDQLSEQAFEFACLLFARVISKPKPGYITLDLGHKTVASENPLDKRVRFLNLPPYRPVSQSEEHLVLEIDEWENIALGKTCYGVPYHICPSVNLYDFAHIIENHKVIDEWKIVRGSRPSYVHK